MSWRGEEVKGRASGCRHFCLAHASHQNNQNCLQIELQVTWTRTRNCGFDSRHSFPTNYCTKRFVTAYVVQIECYAHSRFFEITTQMSFNLVETCRENAI